MRFLPAIVAGFLGAVASACEGTTLDFWHTYKHAKTGELHYAFHLAEYKRGLFWGSCGPSTKSLRWSFNFDLAGDGPVYRIEQITITNDDGKPVQVVSGQIVTDVKRRTARITIDVAQSGATNKFAGNGEYRINIAH
jgi:hypothetical protein